MKNVGANFNPSNGAARGILVLWNTDVLQCVDMVKRAITISCMFTCGRSAEEWMLTGVYCRGNKVERELLWKELKVCKRRWGGNWIVGGDFTIVLRREDRTGESFLES